MDTIPALNCIYASISDVAPYMVLLYAKCIYRLHKMF